MTWLPFVSLLLFHHTCIRCVYIIKTIKIKIDPMYMIKLDKP